MGVGQLEAQQQEMVRLAFELVELREAFGGDKRWLLVRMHLPAGGNVAVIGIVELFEQFLLSLRSDLQVFAEAWVVPVYPTVQFPARLLEVRPCRFFAASDVMQHGAVKSQQAALEVICEAEAF